VAEAPGPGPGLREAKKRDKLRRIVDAAAALFAERGFEGTTGRAICGRAGIGTGTLFSYVRDKRELLFLVFRDDAVRLLEAAPREPAADTGVAEAVIELLRPFVALYARDEALASLFVRELFFRPESETRGMAALNRALADRIEALLARGVARGELRADLDLPRAARAVLAQYVFWIQAWLGLRACPRGAVLPELRGALQLLLRGMAAPRAEETP